MIYTNFTRPDGPRRNLLTYSEQFENAAWVKTRSSITANTVVAPDGTLTGGKLVEDTTASNSHQVAQSVTTVASTVYTFTVYLKAAERTWASLRIFDGTNYTTYFNLVSGIVGTSSAGNTATIESVGNDWYRCSLSRSTASTLTTAVVLSATGDNGLFYTGDGTSGIYIWGAQLEVNGLTEYQPVVSGFEFSVEPLNHARIGWQNLAFGLTPTSSTAAAGFPAIAATYPTTFEFWKPTALPAVWGIDFGSAKTVDYCGLVGDLNGATIEIQSSSNFSTWTTRGTIGPTTDRINMALFLPVEARYWRLLVTVAIPSIAVVYLGQALDMQRMIYQGHTPLTLSRTTELSNNMSEGGQYLGRSIIRKGAQSGFGWRHLKADWYRANFDPFVKSARTMPFFIAWRPSQYPSEMGFVWVDGDIAPSNTGPRDFMAVDMNVMGLINE